MRRDAAGLPGDRPAGLSRLLANLRDPASRAAAPAARLDPPSRRAVRPAETVTPSDLGRGSGGGAAGAAAAGGGDGEFRAGRRAARPAASAGMIDLSLLPDGGIGWLDASGPASHLVLSTRIRLARNLSDHRVRTGRNSETEREAILGRGRGGGPGHRLCCGTRPGSGSTGWIVLDRQLLHERHLVSKELAGLDADGRVRLRRDPAGPGPARGHAQRGGSPPAPGAPFGVRAGGGLRRGRPAGRRTGTTTCLRISS